MVLRRLSGRTENTAPVLTLITQFGGGKTHTLTGLYHLGRAGLGAARFPGVQALLRETGVGEVPAARVAVFVGNAWDPAEGRETLWIDMARQLAGEQGVAALGSAARTTPPGTEAIGRVFALADAPVLLLFDEVLNFVNRHRGMADGFHAFIQNLTVAVTGRTQAAAVISLPRSQVEMTDWDQQWQERITKVVRRVARDLIANDEAEIGEVVRRRLFDDLGSRESATGSPEPTRTGASSGATAFPPMDGSGYGDDRSQSEGCSPESVPSLLSVPSCNPFRVPAKMASASAIPANSGSLGHAGSMGLLGVADSLQGSQNGTVDHTGLGAPPRFRVPKHHPWSVGRIEARCRHHRGYRGKRGACQSPGRGYQGPASRHPSPRWRSHPFRIVRRTSRQGCSLARVEVRAWRAGRRDNDHRQRRCGIGGIRLLHPQGGDGRLQIHHQATLRKVVSDRRASLDREKDVNPAIRTLVRDEFARGASLRIVSFPGEGTEIQDSPHLKLVIASPDTEWGADGQAPEHIASWTQERGTSPRLYPGSLVWCVKKPGRELHDRVELWLAWQRVEREVREGVLGTEFDHAERADIRRKVKSAEEEARDEVWAGYRFVAFSDAKSEARLRVIDLGAGHASASESLCGRIVGALKSEAILNESVGAGYIERHWPPALKEAGAWPLTGLRQSFLDGSLTRLVDPDAVLRGKIVEFVGTGTFGLASGSGDGEYHRVWHDKVVAPDDVVFEAGMFLLTRAKAKELRSPAPEPDPPEPPVGPPLVLTSETESTTETQPTAREATLRLVGRVPPDLESDRDQGVAEDEVWKRPPCAHRVVGHR